MQNIVVGVDFSAPSDNALREAARIARWDRANLNAVYVMDESVIDHLGPHSPRVAGELTAEADGRIHAHVAEVLGSDHGVSYHFCVGNPLHSLARAVKEHSADLLVLGSHGITSPDDRRVGRIASRCARKLPTNVLLVRERQLGPFRNVVACVDFSENSQKAAAQALHIAQQDKAVLRFLHVHEPMKELATEVGYVTALAVEVLGTDPDRVRTARVERSLAEFVDPIIAAGGGDDYHRDVVLRPDLRPALVDYLAQSDADLVVLGTRGRHRIRNAVLGSTAEKIINHASCSTLVVKPGGFDYELS